MQPVTKIFFTCPAFFSSAELASAGVKELIVIAQDITKYGMDLPEHKRLLPELLRELCKMDFSCHSCRCRRIRRSQAAPCAFRPRSAARDSR